MSSGSEYDVRLHNGTDIKERQRHNINKTSINSNYTNLIETSLSTLNLIKSPTKKRSVANPKNVVTYYLLGWITRW